jgi:hypothetical protein
MGYGGEAMQNARIPMDETVFLRAKAAFERMGGEIIQSEEGDRLLQHGDADALTLNDLLVVFRSGQPPTATEFYEEFIHVSQYRKNLVSTDNFIELEIETKEKLVKYQKQYRIPDCENKETIRHLSVLKRERDKHGR